MLFLKFCYLTLILSHQGLLSRVSLVTKLFDDGFYLTIALAHHLFSDLTLGFDMLVLSLFEKLAL